MRRNTLLSANSVSDDNEIPASCSAAQFKMITGKGDSHYAVAILTNQCGFPVFTYSRRKILRTGHRPPSGSENSTIPNDKGNGSTSAIAPSISIAGPLAIKAAFSAARHYW